MPNGTSTSIALFRRFAVLRGRAARRTGGRADARRHNRLLAAVVLPPVAIMLVLALTQEPLRGDLTRPGGYAEADFGWTAPQERFSPPLASTRYDRPHDIVVLGDSFSANSTGQTDPGAYWTNHLAQRTGLSVAVVPVSLADGMNFAQLLRHPVFVRTPPRILIVETVERYLLRNYAIEIESRVGISDPECRAQTHALPPLPALAPLDAAPVPWIRDTSPEIDFDQAADFLWKSAKRRVLGVDTTRVIRLGLNRPDLFSSRASEELLIYDDEIRKAEFVTPRTLDATYCTLLAMQNAVQANGRTRFLFMAAPDKLSAYAEHLADTDLRALSLLPGLYRQPSLNQVRLLERFRSAIRRGEKDVYMPNDTHWGSAGHRIVADAIVAALTRPQAGPTDRNRKTMLLPGNANARAEPARP